MNSSSQTPLHPFLEPAVYDPAAPGATKALLQGLGHTPNRTMGQNFLINPGILDRIINTAAVSNGDSILEIGPGLGALSCRLVRAAGDSGQVAAIEKDPQFIALLNEKLPRLRILCGDALRLDWSELGLPDCGVKVVANLPYSISKPMLRRLLEEWRPHFSTLTLMVQREVADRIVASPNTSAYGPMAIMARLYTRAKRMFDVSPGSFLPPPAVTSSVVQLEILAQPSIALPNEKLFWQVVHAAFGQRRKQLANTLRAVQADKSTLTATLAACAIDPLRRGETLSLEEFARLTDALSSQL